jgi:hypothetical protein
MTEKYEKELAWHAVAAHEGSHVAVAHLLGVPLSGVSRDAATHSGATLLGIDWKALDTPDLIRSVKNLLCVVNAPLREGGIEETWGDGDKAATRTIVEALEARVGRSEAVRVIGEVDRDLKHIMRTPAYRAIRDAVGAELLVRKQLTGDEVRAIAAKARPHKAGRVLSKANETKLQSALDTVLSALATVNAVLATVAAPKGAPKPKRRIVTPLWKQDQRSAEERNLDETIRFLHLMKRAAQPDDADSIVDAFARETKALDARERQEEEERQARIAATVKSMDVLGPDGDA